MTRTRKPVCRGAREILLWPQAWSILLVVFAGPVMAQPQAQAPSPSVDLPKALSDLRLPDEGSHALIRVSEARDKFKVDGSGLAIAVVSTGVNVRHRTFSNQKILAVRNFSGPQENDDVTDTLGQGSHLAATVAGNPLPNFSGGIAPGAGIVAVKVFGEQTSIERVNRALRWIQANPRVQKRPISVILLPIGTGGNFQDAKSAIEDHSALREMATIITALRRQKIAVVAPAGNSYAQHAPTQGMDFPAILPETISSGALFDRDIPRDGNRPLFDLQNGKAIFSAHAGQIVGFSQRLGRGPSGNDPSRTDIFAPGFLITSAAGSAAADPEAGLAVQTGTDQAAAQVAGVILLIQQRYRELTRQFSAVSKDEELLPEVSWIEEALGKGGAELLDRNVNDEQSTDNVPHTGEKFVRLDALGALSFVQSQYVNDVRRIQLEVLRNGEATGVGKSSNIMTKFPQGAKILGREFRKEPY
jgi:subtilisin family serine protease